MESTKLQTYSSVNYHQANSSVPTTRSTKNMTNSAEAFFTATLNHGPPHLLRGYHPSAFNTVA